MPMKRLTKHKLAGRFRDDEGYKKIKQWNYCCKGCNFYWSSDAAQERHGLAFVNR